jgi:hypothetical protein
MQDARAIVSRARPRTCPVFPRNAIAPDTIHGDAIMRSMLSDVAQIAWSGITIISAAVRCILEAIEDPAPASTCSALQAALYVAADAGHACVVRDFLRDRRVNPAADGSNALYTAAVSGHSEIVRLLLRDGRAQPAAEQSLALRGACHRREAEVVELLLADGRADPAAENSVALWTAVLAGHEAIVRLLLADGRADPVADHCEAGVAVPGAALSSAAFRGFTEVVRLLLADGRVDPALGYSEALWAAADRGHGATIQVFMADGRSDPVAASRHRGFRGVDTARPLLLPYCRWWRRRQWLRAAGNALVQ